MPVPLAEKLRPKNLEEFVGQEHLVSKDAPLRNLIENGNIKSMIFWGPPGCGKTTLAQIIAKQTKADFVPFSAVTGGVADIRKIIAEAKKDKGFFARDTILFIDEIHRFNKAQQDSLLPHVEDGTIILIGATTENPGFSVNAPLISRSQVYTLKALTNNDIEKLVTRATKEFPTKKWEKEAINHIVNTADGDARTAINAVELASTLADKITLEVAETAVQKKSLLYDKHGDNHFDTISAFIKSMRGDDVDATLHYLARMISAGEDPVFIARRLVIFASEDVGNATPYALTLAVSCMQAVKMIGMPESQLILAQTACYLANAKKSIATTKGIGLAINDVNCMRIGPIPLHLRNATNKVSEQLGYSDGHIRYPWLEERKTGKKPMQQYLPDELKDKNYYEQDWD